MNKMRVIRKWEAGQSGHLKIQTNFQISEELREAIRLTRGVNYLVPNPVMQKQFEIELEYAPLIGPAGTEKEIRKTVKQFFNQPK